MTQDQKSLLKHGLFWAVVVGTFWLLVSTIQSRAVIAIAMVVWSVFLYVVFYREGLRDEEALQELGSGGQISVRQVFGAGELFWAVQQSRLRPRSGSWPVVTATVEGRDILRFASNAGWLAVRYSYAFAGEVFSGELRMGVRARNSLERDPNTSDFFSRFPQGSHIRVRVDPQNPIRSVAEP